MPGSEAPAAWFDYVLSGYGERLIRVVEHNRQDIVSLAALSVLACQWVEEGRAEVAYANDGVRIYRRLRVPGAAP